MGYNNPIKPLWKEYERIIKDIIPDVAIETGLGGTEILNEIGELVDKQILTLEGSK
jgi:hypothetical protein